MSTIDQAFIRAYQERLAKTASLLPLDAAAPPSEPEDRRQLDAVATDPLPTARIDVLPDATIPPPHANFSDPARESSTAALVSKPALAQSPKASLSSFTQSQPTLASAAARFEPALEVDAVCWPPICARLLEQFPDRFDHLADEILRVSRSGCKIIAIVGIRPGEGRTTLTLCLAKCLASKGKTALIDADFANPQLAQALGIGPQFGWESVLVGTEQLSEITIQSVADHLALVPLAASIELADLAHLNYRIAVTFAELAEHYDLVLVDAGSLMDGSPATNWFLQPTSGVQGIIVAHSARRGEAGRLAWVCHEIADARQNLLGIAEMLAT